MKKIFTTFLIVFSTMLSGKAQWVTIPDANFVAWLQGTFPTCMNGNLMDTTCSGILSDTMLNCNNQNISDLTGIQFFDNIFQLNCLGNSLSNLPTLPSKIKYLNCSNNQLASLPTLPDSLRIFHCGSNVITFLPPLPESVEFLSCENNLLSSLPDFPLGFQTLSCFNNQLTQLPFFPSTFNNLACTNNLLTSLPELPDTILSLRIGYNPIQCLPQLIFFSGAPTMFDISNTGITCLPNIIQHTGNIPAIDTMPICGLFNPNGCPVFWNISGKVYFDANNNCNYDSADVAQLNIPVDLWQGGNLLQQSFTDVGGSYFFDVNSYGTYEVKIDTANIPFTVLCPNTGVHTSVITAIDSMDTDADFSIVCKPNYDVAVNSAVSDSGMFFPGNKSLVNIQAGDFGNFYGADCMNGIGGQLTVTLTGPAQYIGYPSGSIAPSVVSGNTLTWNIADFGAVDFFNDFHIRLLTDNAATVGDFICVDATITSNPADVNQTNNHLNQCFAVVNSFDPNVKEVYPQELTSVNDYLTYTIHFQNTGTAPAQHIQILDTLDSDFDVSTFQLLAYSHANMTQVLEGGIVKFNFPNINLPDSTSNEPASHGYIQYKIKPKAGTPLTSSFDNTASIYFDFNSPVVTNTTHTSFATGISELAVDSWQFSVYPNPFSNQFTVDSKQLAGSTITISDILGRTIYSEQPNQKSVSINLKSISSGIYFIKVQLQNGELQVKKVVRQ